MLNDVVQFENALVNLSNKALQLFLRALGALIVLLIARLIINLLRKMIVKAISLKSTNKSAINFIDSFVKYALYAIVISMIATKFGVDATSIVALVGSAGVAIGLALQGSLSNFAAGILILVTSPFKVGDYIKECSSGNEGIVHEIGLFYTKLLTVDNKEIILPNGQLANSAMINSSSQKERKVAVTFDVSYKQDLAEVKDVVMNCIQKNELVTRKDEAQVFVSELSNHSIKIGARFWVENQNYWPVYWGILEEVKTAFDSKDIEIPYNQLDVHMK